jgi:hypothetical protein
MFARRDGERVDSGKLESGRGEVLDCDDDSATTLPITKSAAGRVGGGYTRGEVGTNLPDRASLIIGFKGLVIVQD